MKRRDNKRWALEFLQVYHLPTQNIKQGWHLVDIFTNETAARKRLVELQHLNCELRVRELKNTEENDYDIGNLSD